MSHSNSLVLLTGGTGHLGFRTLLDLLTLGYKVRAAVRSDAKSKTILDNALFKSHNFPSSQLSFVVVPDLQSTGAYDEAVKGVDYVIHIASPITTGGNLTQEQFVEYFIQPAERGTIGMLKSAATAPSVKRVVITSSVVAQIAFGTFMSGMADGESYNEASRTPFDEGPYHHEFQAYSASKVKALNESEKWMAEQKPAFDLVNIHPSFIEGRDDLQPTAKSTITGTNAVMLSVALGNKAESPLPGTSVHNEDVARLHVEALEPKIPAGSYIATSNPRGALNGTTWQETSALVEKLYPAAVEKGLLSAKGEQKSIAIHIDNSKTEEVFGWKFQSYEKQVESVVGHYLELLEKESA